MLEQNLTSAICLIGGGGHALVVAEAAKLQGREVTGFFDDCGEDSLMYLAATWLGPWSKALNGDLSSPAILAIGDLTARRQFSERPQFGSTLFSVVTHPSSVISNGTKIGDGVFIAAGAVVNCNATVGQHCIVNTRAIVEHDCVLGQNVHVGPGAVLGGGVQIGDNSLVGLNACVKPRIKIGNECVVGAGAVVVQDVEDGQIVMGVPARPVNDEQFARRISA